MAGRGRKRLAELSGVGLGLYTTRKCNRLAGNRRKISERVLAHRHTCRPVNDATPARPNLRSRTNLLSATSLSTSSVKACSLLTTRAPHPLCHSQARWSGKWSTPERLWTSEIGYAASEPLPHSSPRAPSPLPHAPPPTDPAPVPP